jgi:hypothetical protein
MASVCPVCGLRVPSEARECPYCAFRGTEPAVRRTLESFDRGPPMADEAVRSPIKAID